MKATIITSQEYCMNSPSIFAIIDGEYYGCMIYPNSRRYPSVDYWIDATSSDSHRGFHLNELEVSEELLLQIKKLQSCINANEAMIIRKSYPYISSSAWKIRRGSAYNAWKQATEAQSKEIKEEYERNQPFERARSIAHSQLRTILINLKNE